jgi:glucose-6-phosphate dehydrogenase assembly protein OpcA
VAAVPTLTDSVWSEQGTTPAAVETALRGLLRERHVEDSGYLPARALNLVCVVDRSWSGEVANRLRQVGRYHASRTIVCSIEPDRRSLDATATVASDTRPERGQFALMRETVVVLIGDRHVDGLASIVDPLIVTDLPTVVWSPHGHPEAVDRLLGLAQVVLTDTGDEPDVRDSLGRAGELAGRAYVVDLSWLRSTPWRERIAATFDPAHLRPQLALISAVTVRHNPESVAAAALLVGWLASRLQWRVGALAAQDGALTTRASTRRQEIDVRLEPDPSLTVRGLAGLTLQTASGRHLSLERGPGGLWARYRNQRGDEREWTVLGASRGEGGILGEGIRQALLRDPTYAPALEAARRLVG